MTSRLTIGSRGSQLALWQARHVADALGRAEPSLDIGVRVIRTAGDRHSETMNAVSGVGAFVRDIERALMDGCIDLAVHSLKDLPTSLPEGLVLAAILEREDPADVLVSRQGKPLAQLPRGSVVLTGSPRRQALVKHLRNDLACQPIRGNVPTRLQRFRDGEAEAMVLARAGLVRLGLEGAIAERLDPVVFVPAAGQGALAVEVKSLCTDLIGLCGTIDHPSTARCTAAERAVLAFLGAGCRTPCGAWGREVDGRFVLSAFVATPDGRKLVRRDSEADLAGVNSVDDAERIGGQLADELLSEVDGELMQVLKSTGRDDDSCGGIAP